MILTKRVLHLSFVQKDMKTANQQMVNQLSNKLDYSGLCEKSIRCDAEMHREVRLLEMTYCKIMS